MKVNPFTYGSDPIPEPIGKLCPSAFSLILARSFWMGRDVSSAEVHGPRELASRLPPPFEVLIGRKEEPRCRQGLIGLPDPPLATVENQRCGKVHSQRELARVRRAFRDDALGWQSHPEDPAS